jgi:hypothetical protein
MGLALAYDLAPKGRSEMSKSDKQILVKRVSTLNGHGVAALTREADPAGLSTEHLIMLNGRMIDALFDRQRIDPIHHQAATELRDYYERSRPVMGALPARDAEQPMGGGGNRALHSDDQAWRAYIAASRQVKHWWPILRHVCIEDRDPEEYGRKHRCSDRVALKSALDALARHFGLTMRRGAQ